jgi:AcrR family transcriptional regulator
MAGDGAGGKGSTRRGAPASSPARERILDTAYRLFSRHGIHPVGIDRIIADADVAKATLYHHFASKEELAIAFLRLREQRWTREWLQGEVERLAQAPPERALLIFDVFDEWFHRPGFEGCSFINTLLEYHDAADPVRREAVRRLAVVRGLVESWAGQAGARDAQQVGYELQMLMHGAIVSAGSGELNAARRAHGIASLLLDGSR